jgi:acetylornithine deacetylase/succinyl-diaminopimelate desuccinylase-like protein
VTDARPTTTTSLRDSGADALERAVASVTDDGMAELVASMVSISSPTGEELDVANWIVSHLSEEGVDSIVEQVGGREANAVGVLHGSGGGPRLMVYAPLDSPLAGNAAEDEPFVGPDPRPDFLPRASREGGKVVGLGAENPKAFAACGIAALEALARAGVPLRGDVELVLAGGSMPVGQRPGMDRVVGHGAGITYHLDTAPKPDAAIVIKPGWAASHEEVGISWWCITVRGGFNYTGIRHKAPYRNPIVAAARIVERLDAWFPEYSAVNAAGFVAPQGSVNAIRGGTPERAAFIPATCEIDIDLRVAPGHSQADVEAQLAAQLDALRADLPDFEITLEPRAFMPGGHTDPEHEIVRAVVRQWEAVEGKPHAPLAAQSGATDAAAIREAGIPTARIGLPQASTPNPYPGFSMGQADPEAMRRLTQLLIRVIVDADQHVPGGHASTTSTSSQPQG